MFWRSDRVGKRFGAVMSAFLLIAGMHVILYHGFLSDLFSATIPELSIGLLFIAMIVFFIAEMNNKVHNSSVPIGLILGITYGLGSGMILLYSGASLISSLFVVISPIIVMPLASYVYYIMWG